MLINCKQLLLSVYWCMSKDKDPGLHNITSAPAPNSTEEGINRMRKRVDAGDAEAIYNFGAYYANGSNGFARNCDKAVELWRQAAELGHAIAHYNIGVAYKTGEGVARDEKKATHYFELAAIGGDVNARHNLASNEGQAGNLDRALKHYMIAIRGGQAEESLGMVQKMFMNGYATNDDYAKALQARQAYLDEIKNPQRDEAATFDEDCRYY